MERSMLELVYFNDTFTYSMRGTTGKAYEIMYIYYMDTTLIHIVYI